jgi:hypothetical protein
MLCKTQINRANFYGCDTTQKEFGYGVSYKDCTTEIPTFIDHVALGYFLAALGSIIVGISVGS